MTAPDLDKPMTAAMEARLLGLRHASDHWSVKRGLRERGMIDAWGKPTPKGRDYVQAHPSMQRKLDRLLERDPTVEVITNDERLLSLMTHRDDPVRIDVYVYAGSTPMVVRNGDGQKPLAILHPFYLWEIEVERTAGKFLVYSPIIGHKGSYGYDLSRSVQKVAA